MFRPFFPAIGLICLVLLLPVAGWGEAPLEPVPSAALEPAPDAVPDAAPQERVGTDPFPNEVWNAPATDSVDTPDEAYATAGTDLGEVAAAKDDPNVPNVKNVSNTFKSGSIAKITKIMTKEGQKVWGGKLQALKKEGLLTKIGAGVKNVQSYSNGGSDALLNPIKINKKTYVLIMRWDGKAWMVSHLMDISTGSFPPPPWPVTFPPNLLPTKTKIKPIPQ